MESGGLRTQILLVTGEILGVSLETLSNITTLQAMLFKEREVDYLVLMIQVTFIRTINYLISRLTILQRLMMEQTQRPQRLLILHHQVA